MSQPVSHGDTPSEAVHLFHSSLQRLVSCVTRGVLTVGGGYAPSPRPHTIAFPDNRLERMAGESALGLRLNANYLISRQDSADGGLRWAVTIVRYRYSIESLEEQEIVAWHRHPGTPYTASHPHLHLGPAAGIGRAELHRAHLPTGIVTLADIVRSAITDFHVEPRRDDWQTILDAVT